MSITTVKNDDCFKINRIVGSCALEGIIIPADVKQKMGDVICGQTSIVSAKAFILAKYSKR